MLLQRSLTPSLPCRMVWLPQLYHLIRASVNVPQPQPASASSLSISRVQAAYRAADTLNGPFVVTFTVTNNQQPAIVPQRSHTGTITATLDAIATKDTTSGVVGTDPVAETLRTVVGKRMAIRKGDSFVPLFVPVSPFSYERPS
ncbi:MAG: hypothetical protein KatS3mg057_0912 [Herpetosiphonaceae bacterium]|nr:MAG: hypothetical protein KatS3mg057_0912 [Herpetosiphonaceae bacterium]